MDWKRVLWMVWKGRPMLAADLVPVVAVHEHFAPQHQRVAAALGQDAPFEGEVTRRGSGDRCRP
jgi:hypothetical protein